MLDVPLGAHRRVFVGPLPEGDKFDRAAASRVFRALAGVVSGEARGGIGGEAGIERTVGAAQDVTEEAFHFL